jgi:4-hydroxy-2-oxoglutarate aldolase
MSDLAGIYPPIVTSFNEDGSVAYDKLEANLQRWIAEPLDGIVMPGSNSEAAYLSNDERIEIWRVCARALRGTGKRLIAGTGVESTTHSIELTHRAAEIGAEAALVLPPMFYRSQLTHDVLLAHYWAIADASPIPILVYNVPAFTNVDFLPATLLAMAEHPTIVGCKDSSANVVKITSVLAARPEFQVFAGSASALLPFLSIGAVGGITALANFAARPLRELWTAFYEGRLSEARRIQLAIANINNAVTARYGVAGLKYAMDRTGYHGGPVRRPLQPLNAAGRADIEALLANLELGSYQAPASLP